MASTSNPYFAVPILALGNTQDFHLLETGTGLLKISKNHLQRVTVVC
jgi:hypothetical protein